MWVLFSFVLLVFLTVLSQSLAEKIRYDNYTLYRLIPNDVDALKAIKKLEDEDFDYNFWSPVASVGREIDIMVPPYRTKHIESMIESLGMNSEVLMENVQDYIDSEGLRPESKAGTFDWTSYHTLDEYYDFLGALSLQYPGIVTFIQAGLSYEGRQILGVKVSFNPANENNSIFLESGIHAREWITGATSTFILNELLQSTDPAVRRLADTHDWYIFPIFNPDGFVFTHTSNRMWRKTRVPYIAGCFGADPNRNWGYYWNSGGSSALPCSETYRGPTPFSEPSTRSVAQYITSIADKLVGYISFHSFSQLLLLPYGYTSDYLDNYQEMYSIGLKAADSLAGRYGTRYTVGNIVETIYIASGGSMDWVKGIYHTPVAYTYELRDTGVFGFLLPAEQIIPTALETLDSLVTIFEEYESTLKK